MAREPSVSIVAVVMARHLERWKIAFPSRLTTAQWRVHCYTTVSMEREARVFKTTGEAVPWRARTRTCTYERHACQFYFALSCLWCALWTQTATHYLHTHNANYRDRVEGHQIIQYSLGRSSCRVCTCHIRCGVSSRAGFNGCVCVAARIEPTGEPFSPRFKKILNWTATVVAFFQAAWAGMHFFYLRLDQRALHWAEGVVWTDHPMWFTPEWLSSAVLLFVSAACLSTPLLAIGSGGSGVGATRPAASLAAPDR